MLPLVKVWIQTPLPHMVKVFFVISKEERSLKMSKLSRLLKSPAVKKRIKKAVPIIMKELKKRKSKRR